MDTYDVVIIGGGICGTALAYVLSTYSTVSSIALLEKYDRLATISSHPHSNSQTLHFGDIETNYSLEKAKGVCRAAEFVKHYILKNDPLKKTYSVYPKMVIAVGVHEVRELTKRYESIRAIFPKLRLITRDTIAQIEPNVIKDRNPNEEIVALYSAEGYTMDYQALSESFIANAKKQNNRLVIRYNSKVTRIRRKKDHYEVTVEGRDLRAAVVIVSAGASSLLFAKKLGYGKDITIASVAGSFFFTPQKLNGKVYTMQESKLPFAAVHGDPEVHDVSRTRFGPTAKLLFMLERYHYDTIKDYVATGGLRWSAIQAHAHILKDPVVRNYLIRNFFYDWPIIGKRLFLREVRKVVPTVKAGELRYAKGYGANRAQIINLRTRQLQLGEAKIVGDHIIFNITPSPGASTCLANAMEDAEKIVGFLGKGYRFDKKKFLKDLS